MKLKNRYYILRHGQTDWQTKKKEWTYPKLDSPKIKLTKRGEIQIKEAAQKFKGRKIDLIFSSDFFRTRQTSKIVAKALGVTINFDKRLRDVNLGIYQGGKKGAFYKRFPKHSQKRFLVGPQSGESWYDCQKRMLNFLKEIDKKHKGRTILIVSHGDPLWLLEGAVRKWSPEKMLKEKDRSYIKVGEVIKLYGT